MLSPQVLHNYSSIDFWLRHYRRAFTAGHYTLILLSRQLLNEISKCSLPGEISLSSPIHQRRRSLRQFLPEWDVRYDNGAVTYQETKVNGIYRYCAPQPPLRSRHSTCSQHGFPMLWGVQQTVKLTIIFCNKRRDTSLPVWIAISVASLRRRFIVSGQEK